MGHKVYTKHCVKNMAALQQTGRNHIRRVIQSFNGLPSRRTEREYKEHCRFREGRSLKKLTSFGKSLIFPFTLFLAWFGAVKSLRGEEWLFYFARITFKRVDDRKVSSLMFRNNNLLGETNNIKQS